MSTACPAGQPGGGLVRFHARLVHAGAPRRPSQSGEAAQPTRQSGEAAQPTRPGRLSAPPQAHITLPRKAVGDAVNLEVDVTAKYVERSVGGLAQRVAELEAEVARLKAAQ